MKHELFGMLKTKIKTLAEEVRLAAGAHHNNVKEINEDHINIFVQFAGCGTFALLEAVEAVLKKHGYIERTWGQCPETQSMWLSMKPGMKLRRTRGGL